MSKLLAIDNSGSTSWGSNDYWVFAEKLIQDFPMDENNQIVFWGTHVRKAAHKREAIHWCKYEKGSLGGTAPEVFLPYLKDDTDLILVTDGQVDSNQVYACDAFLEGKTIKKAEVHLVGNKNQMNLSVPTPFTRNTECLITVNHEPLYQGNTADEVDLSVYEGDPDKFLDDSEELLRTITLKHLGRGDLKMRNELIALHKNLQQTLSAQNSANSSWDALRSSLETGDYEQAFQQMKAEVGSVGSTKADFLARVFDALVKACDHNRNFSFQLLQPGRLQRADNVQPQHEEELPPVEDYQGEFECPISIEQESPVLLISRGQPIFHDTEKNYLDNLITNPLLVLNNPLFVQRIRERLDHPIGFTFTAEHFSEMKSPFTRRNLSSFLSLENVRSHRKATNFALADIFFGRKLVGLPELWLAVIYFVCKNIEYLQGSFLSSFEEYMKNRMKTQHTNITLTGLPINPVMKAPVDLSIWYCVVSPFLQGRKEEEENNAVNRLRAMGSSSSYLCDLVELFGYPYKEEETRRVLAIYSLFSWMMKEEKTPGSQWRLLLRAQVQNSLTLESGQVILLDGEAKSDKPFFDTRFLPLGLVFKLASLVDASKKSHDVFLPISFASPSLVDLQSQVLSPVRHYGYSNEVDFSQWNVEICPSTLRPYTIDRREKKYWKDVSEKLYGPLENQLSANNYFIRFVEEKERYPSKEEFMLYMAEKERLKEVGARDTLPSVLVEIVENIFSRYEKVLGKPFSLDPKEFKRRTALSRSRDTRMDYEQ